MALLEALLGIGMGAPGPRLKDRRIGFAGRVHTSLPPVRLMVTRMSTRLLQFPAAYPERIAIVKVIAIGSITNSSDFCKRVLRHFVCG